MAENSPQIPRLPTVYHGALVNPTKYPRRVVSIANPNAVALTLFQVKVTLSYSAGFKPDFSDLIFLGPDGTSVIPHWIQDVVRGVSAVVWVRVPLIPASSSINVYATAVGFPINASNGFAVFDFFDDFSQRLVDTAKWKVTATDVTCTVGTARAVAEMVGRAATGGSGLIATGSAFHFTTAGTDDTTAAVAYVYPYAMSQTGAQASSGNYQVPPRCSGGDIRADNGRLLWSSGGTAAAVVWEHLSASPYTRQRIYNFSALPSPDGGTAKNALIAYYGPGQILVMVGGVSPLYNTKLYLVNLLVDPAAGPLPETGNWYVDTVWNIPGLGIPQSIEYVNDTLYYLVDDVNAAGVNQNTGSIYKIQLTKTIPTRLPSTLTDDQITAMKGVFPTVPGNARVLDRFWGVPGGERNGLSHDGTNWYYGDAALTINRLVLNSTSSLNLKSGSTANTAAFLAANGYPVSASAVLGSRMKLGDSGLYAGIFLSDNAGSTLPTGANNLLGLLRPAQGSLAVNGRQTAATAQTQQAYGSTLSNVRHDYEMKYVPGASINYSSDGVSLGTVSSGLPSAATVLYPTIGGNTAAGGVGFSETVDWIYARKYAAVEPTVTLGALV